MEKVLISIGGVKHVDALCFMFTSKVRFLCDELAEVVGIHFDEGIEIACTNSINVPFTYRVLIPHYCKPEVIFEYLEELEKKIEVALGKPDVLAVVDKGLGWKK